MQVLIATRETLATLIVAVVCLSCSGGPTLQPSQPGRTHSASLSTLRPSSGPSDTQAAEEPGATELSPAPSSAHARALAEELDQVAATLSDPGASPADARAAGEFQQLAVRGLADRGRPFRRAVLRRLDADNAAVVRACITASRTLGGLTPPQRQLPRWRIAAPPSPQVLLGHYRAAQRRTGVPWRYLAAIHLVETRMGRIRGTSTAGAQGPMQFLPSTWDIYGAGGDINDPRDAILAAARLLRANGAPRHMSQALWHYNPSDRYVRAVSAYAGSIRRAPWAYRGYWQWRVLYKTVRGTYLLPVGYPERPAVPLKR